MLARRNRPSMICHLSSISDEKASSSDVVKDSSLETRLKRLRCRQSFWQRTSKSKRAYCLEVRLTHQHASNTGTQGAQKILEEWRVRMGLLLVKFLMMRVLSSQSMTQTSSHFLKTSRHLHCAPVVRTTAPSIVCQVSSTPRSSQSMIKR